jgi:tetratricopeptide (TPR) repeat protein
VHISQLEANETTAKAINLINDGRFKEADAALAGVLAKHPKNYQALVARGTCRALAGSARPGELRKAEADFTEAIEMLPGFADVWKRRSQARAALGNVAGATRDLQDCLKLCAPPARCVARLTLIAAHGPPSLRNLEHQCRCVCVH